MRALLTYLRQKPNRTALSFLGGGVVVAAGGLWVVVTYFFPPPKPPPAGGQSVSIGRDNTNSPITLNGGAARP